MQKNRRIAGLIPIILFVLFVIATLCDQTRAQEQCSQILPLRSGSKWGYADTRGSVVITPQFELAAYFTEGRAIVHSVDGVGIIDKHAHWVLPAAHGRQILPSTDERFLVKERGRAYFVDLKGKPVTPDFEDAAQFGDGLAPVKLGGKWGFIDRQGKWVIDRKYDEASSFSDGLATVVINGKEFVIDRTGNVQFEVDSKIAIQDFSEGFARFWTLTNEKYGYLNKKGRPVVAPRFRNGRPFSNGRAAVFTDSGWGFIDSTGSMAIRPFFLDTGDFHGGLAAVKDINGKWGYIDKTGKMVIKADFEQAFDFNCGIAKVEDGGHSRYINMTGEYLF